VIKWVLELVDLMAKKLGVVLVVVLGVGWVVVLAATSALK